MGRDPAGSRRRRGWLALWCLVGVAACAPRAGVRVPGDGGEAVADGAARFASATRACTEVRTLTAEASLAGRVEGERVRGRLLAGLDRAGALRIEALAPFGAPAFVLVAAGGESTLFLPREDRVLTGARVEEVLEALAGLPLGPSDLLAVLAGCVSFEPVVSAAFEPAPGWTDVRLSGGDRAWLRESGGSLRVAAATRRDVAVEYEWQGGRFPARVTISRGSRPGRDGGGTRFTLSLSQIESNVELPASAFRVEVPASARPLSLDELRRSGTLAR
jgi:hypothetical protein